MKRFAQIVNDFWPLGIFAKRSILEVWQGSEYASDVQSDYQKNQINPLKTNVPFT